MTSTTEPLVLALSLALKKHAWRLVTAESCTAGGLAYAITALPGSSQWFERGFITYSNQAKHELLGVSNVTLNYFGAVSEQTACEMAEGALHHSNAEISIAITGIAGPDGGSPDKPVGTVWFAWAGKNKKTMRYKAIFTGNRAAIREASIKTALEKLLAYLS